MVSFVSSLQRLGDRDVAVTADQEDERLVVQVAIVGSREPVALRPGDITASAFDDRDRRLDPLPMYVDRLLGAGGVLPTVVAPFAFRPPERSSTLARVDVAIGGVTRSFPLVQEEQE